MAKKHTLVIGGRTYEIAFTAGQLRPPAEVVAFRLAILDPVTMRALRLVLGERFASDSVHRMDDHEVVQLIAGLVRDGTLTIYLREQPLDPAIEALELIGAAKAGAYELKRLFPHVRFTSGRRTLASQARVMADNVVQRRKWIERTYVSTRASRDCQAWVDAHPEATSSAAIAAGLLSVLENLPESEAAKISKHLSGEAFDVQPVPNGGGIKAAMARLTGATKFLDREGGLVRWHVQF